MITREIQEEAKIEFEDRKVFRRVFSTEDGKNVLTWILNECRYFSQDPKEIDPLLLGFSNRLLGKIGILHTFNLFDDVKVRIDNSNDKDLDHIINTKIEGGEL
jgi:hypothetical protein